MYVLKEEIAEQLKRKYRGDYFAKEIGISNTYISLILNRKKTCPKRIAYCITKVINNEAEIEEYFERIK